MFLQRFEDKEEEVQALDGDAVEVKVSQGGSVSALFEAVGIDSSNVEGGASEIEEQSVGGVAMDQSTIAHHPT